MKPRMVTCSLCGYVFDPQENSNCRACPLGSACASICCPKCGYQTIDEEQSGIVKLVRKISKKVNRDQI